MSLYVLYALCLASAQEPYVLYYEAHWDGCVTVELDTDGVVREYVADYEDLLEDY